MYKIDRGGGSKNRSLGQTLIYLADKNDRTFKTEITVNEIYFDPTNFVALYF